MTDAEFKELQATFPWSEVVHPNGLVVVFDRNGDEVPLFAMTAFLKMITTKLAKRVEVTHA